MAKWDGEWSGRGEAHAYEAGYDEGRQQAERLTREIGWLLEMSALDPGFLQFRGTNALGYSTRQGKANERVPLILAVVREYQPPSWDEAVLADPQSAEAGGDG